MKGIVGPKGLPTDVVCALNAAGNQALQDAGQCKTMYEQADTFGLLAGSGAGARPLSARASRGDPST